MDFCSCKLQTTVASYQACVCGGGACVYTQALLSASETQYPSLRSELCGTYCPGWLLGLTKRNMHMRNCLAERKRSLLHWLRPLLPWSLWRLYTVVGWPDDAVILMLTLVLQDVVAPDSRPSHTQLISCELSPHFNRSVTRAQDWTREGEKWDWMLESYVLRQELAM